MLRLNSVLGYKSCNDCLKLLGTDEKEMMDTHTYTI